MSQTIEPNDDNLPDVSNAGLSMEAQFDLVAIESQIDKMSREDAIRMAKSLNRQMILQKYVFKGMVRKHGGI